MKTLQESILDKQKTIQDSGIIPLVHKWMKENTDCSSYTIDPHTYYINSTGNVEITNKSIVEFPDCIHFGKVSGYFDCSYCRSLKTLKGSPREVIGLFDCSDCDSLTSLEGAPKKVKDNFYCYNCKSLTSLEGSSEKVGANFICYNCKSLTSLEDAPKEVGGNFYCYNCKSLKSLKGISKSTIKGKIYSDIKS